MAQRRNARGGPGGTRRPGGRGAPQRPRSTAGAARQPSSGRRRPRFTGRAAILVLVVAVLTVSYASSLRAYLQQREHIADLKTQIAERSAAIDDLEREKRRWNDPAYVQAQARERFGYLMPGETSYVVLGEDGKPIDSDKELPDPSEVLEREPQAWWEPVWESTRLAGEPPRHQAPPAADIGARAGKHE
jgi:cell division protein FtsB